MSIASILSYSSTVSSPTLPANLITLAQNATYRNGIFIATLEDHNVYYTTQYAYTSVLPNIYNLNNRYDAITGYIFTYKNVVYCMLNLLYVSPSLNTQGGGDTDPNTPMNSAGMAIPTGNELARIVLDLMQIANLTISYCVDTAGNDLSNVLIY
jgi:hypothetical protein